MRGSGGYQERDVADRGRLGGSDCERLRDGWLVQPVNAVTSLAYVAAGAAVLAGTPRGVGRQGRAEVAALAATLALVGLGSVAFHGPQPPGARLMHDLPIVGVLGVLAATPALRHRRGLPALPGWSRRGGALAAGLGALAGLAYVGGRTGAPTCDPDSPVQLHGAWHMLSAAAFVVVGGFLRAPHGDSA
jgi:hypothetical protein